MEWVARTIDRTDLLKLEWEATDQTISALAEKNVASDSVEWLLLADSKSSSGWRHQTKEPPLRRFFSLVPRRGLGPQFQHSRSLRVSC